MVEFISVYTPEDDGQKDEPVVEAESDDEKEDLEKGDEDEGLRRHEERERQERREAAVEDGRTHVGHALKCCQMPNTIKI